MSFKLLIHCSISDYIGAERYWSPKYIQHSAHIQPGREGLFNLIKSIPSTLKYEPGTIVADGDFVMVYGRYSGFGHPVNWIIVDILRIEDGMLVEHWDVIEEYTVCNCCYYTKKSFVYISSISTTSL